LQLMLKIEEILHSTLTLKHHVNQIIKIQRKFYDKEIKQLFELHPYR